MRLFYYASYPFVVALNASSNFLLRRLGAVGTVFDDRHHPDATS